MHPVITTVNGARRKGGRNFLLVERGARLLSEQLQGRGRPYRGLKPFVIRPLLQWMRQNYQPAWLRYHFLFS
jgi:hypothetical protein